MNNTEKWFVCRPAGRKSGPFATHSAADDFRQHLGAEYEDMVIERARQTYRAWEAEQAARPWWRKALDALKRP